MDYPTIHGQDLMNFSSPSPHRMPTVSAAQVLQEILSPIQKGIATGLKGLDIALQNRNGQTPKSDDSFGGVVRGKVTEIYGPPGVGKTALGMQLTVNALLAGQSVVWIDAANPLPGTRLLQLLEDSTTASGRDNSLPAQSLSTAQLLANLHHITVSTLPQLIATLGHSSPTFPPVGTSLMIIDSLSTLITNAYPRTGDHSSTSRKPGTAAKQDAQHWATTRKWAVLQYLISTLQKLATIRNIAVVITNQTVTKMQSGAAAMLVPAIASKAWDAGIASRIMLYRDWGWNGKQVRFATALKAEGLISGKGSVGTVIPFTIDNGGLEEMQIPTAATLPEASLLATPARKRKRDEIRDSEDEDDLEGSDEDYGWEQNDDEELPEPPPQWQGSEDILITQEDDGEEEPNIEWEEEEDPGDDDEIQYASRAVGHDGEIGDTT